MARDQIKVPYGYQPTSPALRGTLIVLETFEDWSDEDMALLAAWADERKFARVVLYPQHEETLRRMNIPCQSPYHARVKLLEELIADASSNAELALDAWEGKRKKYTPIDTSLNFLTDKYHGPYFVCMSDRYANLFVTYASFAEWIKKVRMVIMDRFHVPLHDKLHASSDRWEVLGGGSRSQ